METNKEQLQEQLQEPMQIPMQIHSHKVGTFTLGVTLVVTGILFLLKTLFQIVSYSVIFKIWPLVFILLGVEILLANRQKGSNLFVYDITGIVLVVMLTFFAMFVAVIGRALEFSVNF